MYTYSHQTAATTTSDAGLTEPANQRWWLWPVVVGGAGAALMLGGVATGVMASSKQKELDDKCKDGVCDPKLQATADSGKTLALVTDVLLIGGGAALATGVVFRRVRVGAFFYVPPDSDSAARDVLRRGGFTPSP